MQDPWHAIDVTGLRRARYLFYFSRFFRDFDCFAYAVIGQKEKKTGRGDERTTSFSRFKERGDEDVSNTLNRQANSAH